MNSSRSRGKARGDLRRPAPGSTAHRSLTRGFDEDYCWAESPAIDIPMNGTVQDTWSGSHEILQRSMNEMDMRMSLQSASGDDRASDMRDSFGCDVVSERWRIQQGYSHHTPVSANLRELPGVRATPSHTPSNQSTPREEYGLWRGAYATRDEVPGETAFGHGSYWRSITGSEHRTQIGGDESDGGDDSDEAIEDGGADDCVFDLDLDC